MIELHEHAVSHVIPRLFKVIDGQDAGGITEAEDWKGGGGFRYYTLAPSLLEKDKYDNWVISKKYDANMLAAAVCKLMGFAYEPSRDEREYWRHGHSTETDFIYVTTQSLTYDALKRLSEDVGRKRTLLVCCKAYNAKEDAFDNITLRKIPQVVLKKCEWGRDDYSLKIAKVAPPEEPVATAPPEPEAEAVQAATPKKRTRNPRKKPDADTTPDMFAKRVGA
jgi:adenine-specific DNA-methyltransferase